MPRKSPWQSNSQSYRRPRNTTWQKPAMTQQYWPKKKSKKMMQLAVLDLKKQPESMAKNTNKVPCNLCEVVLPSPEAYEEHINDSMHVELAKLLTMKSTCTENLIKSNAQLLTERENVKIVKENPKALEEECSECYCNFLRRDPDDKKSHERSKHHLISKMYKHIFDQCFICNTNFYTKYKFHSHIKHTEHLQAMDKHIRQGSYENSKEIFNQEENLPSSCDKGINFAEMFESWKQKAEEISNDTVDYDSTKPIGVDSITWKWKNFCLPCKLSLTSTEGPLVSELHCSMPDHYEMMTIFLKRNANMMKASDPVAVSTPQTECSNCKTPFFPAGASQKHCSQCQAHELQNPTQKSEIQQLPSPVQRKLSATSSSTIADHGQMPMQQEQSLTSKESDSCGLTPNCGEDWIDFVPDMKLDGKGGVIFGDGVHYTSKTVEVRRFGPKMRFRFIVAKEPSVEKLANLLMTPEQAFASLSQILVGKGLSVESLQIPSSPSFRGFSMNIDNFMFSGPFLRHMVHEFAITGMADKFEWVEAQPVLGIHPSSFDNSVLPEDFLDFITGQKLSEDIAAKELNIYFDKLPNNLLDGEYTARHQFLNVLNALFLLESLAASEEKEPKKNAILAVAKIILDPLVHAARSYMSMKLSLRKAALLKVDSENPHVLTLLKSNPISSGLFFSKAIADLKNQCIAQSISLSALLSQEK